MIESIHIEDISYFSESPEEMSGLSKINFVYGPNGSGKTTISRLIAAADRFPSCAVKWKNGDPLPTFVYNSDFVEENFSQEKIKGIFTLGKDDIGIGEKIEKIGEEIAALDKTVSGLKTALEGENGDGGKKRELEDLESEFEKTCWKQKTKHDEHFKIAFKGYRGDRSRFRDKVLEESKYGAAELKPIGYLKKKAEDIFEDNPSEIDPVPSIGKDDILRLLRHEKNPVLGKKIIGKEDVDIGAMIHRLGNSDWVKAGRTYFDGEACPFCQQKTPKEFEKSLNEYFDETFEEDMETLKRVADSYEADSEEIRKQILSVMKADPGFLNIGAMEAGKVALDRILEGNARRIEEKKNRPSLEAILETVSGVIAEMEGLVKEANDAITEHNESVRNIDRETEELTKQVWKYIVEEELKDAIERYEKDRRELKRSIGKIKDEICSMLQKRDGKKREIEGLEKERKGVQRTVDEINSILSSVGFGSFRLARADGENFYRVVRNGGTDAKETLSEGEKRFVTFLYFYHLLKGSQSSDGVARDCVVVFDDPVSSLDGDILFVISSLIKRVFEEIREGEGNVRQAFVLTHNVYFHREVTYDGPGKPPENERTFWIVRRHGANQKLKKSEDNPIKTSYELLWAGVRDSESSPPGTTQNTMRRILEHYFKILGGTEYYRSLLKEFEGPEKMVCNSLISWMNAGSHHVFDDLHMSDDSDDLYRKVFREIFEKSEHIAHYDMMMGDSPFKNG